MHYPETCSDEQISVANQTSESTTLEAKPAEEPPVRLGPIRIRRRDPGVVVNAASSCSSVPSPETSATEANIRRAGVRTRRRAGHPVAGVTTGDVCASPKIESHISVQLAAPPRPRSGSRRRARCDAAPPVVASSAATPLSNRPDESLEVKINYHSIEELKLPKRQLRTHKPKQVEQIVSAIRRMGFINPIIVDAEFNIVCGVGRYLAAREIGLSRLPTIMVTHLSDAELRAYSIADNKLVLNDTWDEQLLAVELKELMVFDIDLPIELTQFDMIEIDNILHVQPKNADPELGIDPDGAEPISRTGDMFQLGEHRMLCGDSRSEDSFQALLGEERVRCVFSDNPYNIKISGNVSGLGKVKHGEFIMASGEMTRDEFTVFLTAVFTLLVLYSVDGAIHFQCMDHRHLREMIDAGDAAYGELKTLVVWDKQMPAMGSFYRNQFELVFVYKVGTAPHRNNFGLGEWGRNRSSVWSYPGANAMRRGRLETLALHPTVKSLPMVMDAIRDVSHRGEIVLDPFSGAATTILACENTGRIGRAIELDPKYIDVGILRWEKATGKQAIHMATGLTFAELRALRRGGDLAETDGELPGEADLENDEIEDDEIEDDGGD